MSRQYIFKLTPNKKNVFINTSVLEEGKYADVSYPIQYKNNSDLHYTLDRDTYKFIDTDIDNIKSSVYPVSMDISVNIPDIPFYAQNKQLSNYSIIFENYTEFNGNILSIFNALDTSNVDVSCYPEYNIDIKVNWSDELPNDIKDASISYTIWIEKYEKVPSDKQEFSDLSDYLKEVEEYDKLNNKHTVPETSVINGVSYYNCEFIKTLPVDKIIEYNWENGKEDNSLHICTFRDSLYEGRRAVAKLKINAVFTDNHTGRTVNATAETIIYQAPYLGKKISYDLVSFVDYTQPLELFSPTVTYDYVHDDNANDKVDSDTDNIKSVIHVNADIKATSDIYMANINTVNKQCNIEDIPGFPVYAYDKNETEDFTKNT